ncbi:hypothetical protein CPC08DRAFT_762926 [Agrocybe pediades]|nr:hypothetical protein CPC08DRAFT_762926 [Agrocybe pediades]
MSRQTLEPVTFPKDIIALGLTIRYPTDGSPGTYHWLIWVSEDGVSGTCAHATNDTGAFTFEKKCENIGTSRNNLSALIQIGSLRGTHSVDDVVEILEKVPMKSPAGSEDEHVRFTCRIWIREAVRVLNSAGIIACGDVNALEEECKAHADANREAVELGKGKVVFVVSKYSK